MASAEERIAAEGEIEEEVKEEVIKLKEMLADMKSAYLKNALRQPASAQNHSF